MDIRDRIRAVIEENPELTVRNVSLAAGLSDSALSKFLKGSVDSLTLKTVGKLADALDVDARWLAYGEGSPERMFDVGDLLSRIDESDMPRVKAILETFARTGTDG